MTDQGTPRPGRPAPVERAEAELLAGRAQSIAKGWLLTLLERAPLDAIATIPAAALAAEGPAVCAAFARALGSDAALDRLRPGGDLAPLAQRIGRLAGARDAAATLAAIDALRATLWAAALDARGTRADGLPALAERLADVTLVAGQTALAATQPVAADADRAAADADRMAPSHADQAGGASEDDSATPLAESPRLVTGPAGSSAGPEPAGQQPPTSRPAGQQPPTSQPAGQQPPDPQATVTELPRRTADEASAGALLPAMDDGDLWIATLERHVDRAQREGGGLALLRVELVDGDRLIAGASAEERGVPYGRLAQAIRRAIRRQDLVAADRQGRAWVIAPAVGRAGAIALAERIGAGVEHGEHWRGAPLAATIGFAIYGEDGHDAVALMERAEEAMLAASAAGVRIGEALPAPGRDDGGGDERPGPRLVR